MNSIKVVGVRNPIPLSQIMYIIGNGNYSNVYTDDGKHILTPMTLKVIEEQSTELIRIHKSALINPDFIEKVSSVRSVGQRTLAPITMRDGKLLPVSRRRNDVLFSIMRHRV